MLKEKPKTTDDLFDALIDALNEEQTKEKREDYRTFVTTIAKNILMWKAKYDYYRSNKEKD